MRKWNELVLKVKKLFHKDPESIRLERVRELERMRKLVAEYKKKLELEAYSLAGQPEGKEQEKPGERKTMEQDAL